MLLADLGSYSKAHRKVLNLYADRRQWNRKMILNIASSGKFSTDRTITEYAEQIWKLKRHPVPFE